MANVSVTVKESGATSQINSSSGETYLTSPSIVKIDVDRLQVASIARANNDLIVTLNSGEKIVLKNFYMDGGQGSSELVLQEHDGALWWVQDPATNPHYQSIASLDEVIAGETGTESGGAILPLALFGLTGAGIATAMALEGRHHDHNRDVSRDVQPPSVPTGEISEDGRTLSGTAEAGSIITLTLPDGSTLQTLVGSDGHYSLSLGSALVNGEQVTVVATDPAGNQSPAGTITAPDTTAPEAPTAEVSDDGSTVTGQAEPGSTVTIMDSDGNVLGTASVGVDGFYSVLLANALTNGETLTAMASDAAGNDSAQVTVTAPDNTAPDAPTANISEDGTSVSGIAEAGSLVTVTLPDGGTATAVATAEGTYSVALTEALTAGELLTVTATDTAGNTSAPTTITAPDTTVPDTTPPEAPVAEISDDGLTVTGTAEAGSTVTVTMPDDTELTTTADQFGRFSVDLGSALTNGETVTITATDTAGNTSEPTTATAPDSTAPDAPADLTVAEDGTSVSGTAEAGSTVTITDADGNEIGSATVADDGTFTVPLATALTNGETVTAVVSDPAGNDSAAVTVTAPDTTAPDAPADLTVAEDGTSVSGIAEAGSTVTITDADGNELGSATVADDGTFTVPLATALTNGETVTAVVSDPAGNDSAAVTVTASDSTAPDAPTLAFADDGTQITGTAEAGTTVTLTAADGTSLGSALVNADGTYSVTLTPALTNGETVTAIATDAAGNDSAAATVTAPDTTAPDAPADLTVAEDGASVSGTGEAGSTVTITDADGNELGSATVADDGTFTVPLATALTNGETVTAVVSDPAGNDSAAVNVTAPDSTAPDAPTFTFADDGTFVAGTAEAGTTVTLTAADGTSLGSALVNADGTYSVTLTPALNNGETVTLTATDATGNISAPITAVAPDITAPDTPADLTVAEDGASVSGTGEAGSTITLTDADGNELGSATVADDGTFTVPLATALTNGETITAVASDAAGNDSAAVTVTATDTTAPDAPADLTVAEDGSTVTGSGEIGSTITLTDAEGNPLGSAIVGDDGTFTVPLVTALTNGETITAVASDAAGNDSAAVTVTAPDTTAPDAPTANISEDGASITGVAEAGALVTVTLPDGGTATATATAEGTYTVPLAGALTAGEEVTVTATDTAGNISAAVTITAPDTTIPDTTPPDAPVAEISEDGLMVTGTAEAGSTVTVTMPDDTEVETTADRFGRYSVALRFALNSGETVTVTATDESGNTSSPTVAEAPDTIAPDAPADLTVAEDGASVSGIAEAGSIITVTDADGNPLGSVAVAEDGTFTVPLTTPLTNGETVTLTATDAAGNTSTPTTAIAPDTTAPDAPADLTVAEDGTSVSGTGEAGSTVTVTDPDGNVLGSATIGEDGTFTVPLTTTLTNGETVTAVISDAAGNESAAVTVTAPDTTAPDEPAELTVAEDGSSVSGTGEAGSIITLTDADGNQLGSATVAEDGTFTVPLTTALTNGETVTAIASDAEGNDSAAVTVTAPDSTAPDAPTFTFSDDGSFVVGTAEAGSTVTLTAEDGTILGSALAVDGTYTLTLTPALINGETVTLTATDATGNISAPVTAIAPDITAPDTPADLTVAEDGSSVSGTGEAGSIITITDAEGNQLGSVTVADDGTFTVPLATALTNGETITAVASDAVGNDSAAVTAIAPDTTAPDAPADLTVADDGASVSGIAEAGSTITLTDAEGNPLGSVTVADDGSFTVPLTTALTNGETITAVASDPAGNDSAAVTVDAPDTTAPDVPSANISEDGSLVLGAAEAGSLVTVTLPGGDTVTTFATAEGTYSVPLSDALTAGQEVTVTATDAAGNISATITVTAPDTTIPDTTAPDAPIAEVSEDGLTVTGTAEAGSTLTVTMPDDTEVTTTADEFGRYSVGLSFGLTSGETVTVTATDAAGNISTPTIAEAPDTLAPDAPADLTVAEDGASVSGAAEAGSTVTVTDADGNLLGIAPVAEDGTFTVPLTTALTNGETVTVTATDAAGNTSTPTTAIAPDTTVPDAPADLTVAEDGASVSGTGEAGSTITITDAEGNQLGSATVGDDGTFTVPLTTALTNGETITAVSSDAAGNDSAPITAIAPDTTAPDAPADLTVTEDGASVSGTGEAGSTVIITDADGNQLGSATVGEDGTFTVPLITALTNGETLTAIASDTAGNDSAAVTLTAPDITAPDAPADLTVAEDGATVSGIGEAGSIITITDANGNELGSVTVGDDGLFTVPLATALTNGETLIAIASDAAGNDSAAVTAIAPDITLPDAPADLTVAEDGTSVSGTGEAGNTITITDADGEQVGSATVRDDGTFTVPLTTALTNGETVTLTATDAAGNISEPVTAIAPDTTAPDTPAELTVAEDGASVSGIGEAGSIITITDAEGNELGSVTVGDDGLFTVPLATALTNGETVTAVASDAAGNDSAAVTATAPDTTAPDAPAGLTVAEDGSSVSGIGEAGSIIIITDGDGTPLGSAMVAEDGTFTVPLGTALTNGETLTVTATDTTGNISDPVTTIAPDTTAPDVPADLTVAEDGASVSGSGEPGSTITITDADGNELGSATVADDGIFTVPLTTALTNGETITAVASDAAGNDSAAVTVIVPDTTAPAAPTLDFTDDGAVITGTAEAGSTLTFTTADGAPLGSALAVDGTYSLTLTPALANGETIIAIATDASGNASAPTTATAPDITAPDAPGDLIVAEDGASVSGTGEAGSIIAITDANGNELGSSTVNEDGSFTVPLTTALTNGETLIAIASDAVGNDSAAVTVTAPDTTAPAAPTLEFDDDGTLLTGTAEAGSTVILTAADGTPLGSVLAVDGTYSVTLTPALTNGETVTVAAIDAAGNASASVTATAPDITAPDAPAELTVAEDGLSVSGIGEAGSIVTLTAEDGTPLGSVTVAEDGTFTVPLGTAQTNGETITAVASDAVGNDSAAVTVIAPDTTAPGAPVDLAVAEDGASVTGIAEAGSTVTLTAADGTALGSATAGEDGTFTVPLTTPLTNGEIITAVTIDPAGNDSAAVTVAAPDTTAPDAPSANISEDGTQVIGAAEADSLVTVTLPGGDTVTAFATAEGIYSAPLAEPLAAGAEVTVTATDTAGNISEATTITVPDTTIPDTTAPDAPVAEVSEDGLTVFGTAEAGSQVRVLMPDDTVLVTTADEFGRYSLGLSAELGSGETVTVTATDAAGNTSAPTIAEAPDIIAPEAPVDLTVAEDGASVSGIAEAGSTVTVTDSEGNQLGTAPVDEDGTFTVPLTTALTNGETLSVTATDAAGNTSTPNTIIAPDTTIPDAPEDLTVAEDGASVSGIGEAGSIITVTDADGNELGSVTVAENGTFTVPLTTALTNGETVTAVASDAVGNDSVAVTAIAPDTTAPDAPAELTVAEDGASVSGIGEPGSIITVTDAEGNQLGSVGVAEDGTFTVPLGTALTNGETLTAVASDAAGNDSAAVTATAPDTTAPDTPAELTVAEDGASVSGIGEAGSTITLTDAEGNELGSVTVAEDGTFTVPLTTALTNGEIVTAVASDAVGNDSAAVTAIAPDSTAPDAPAELSVAEDGTSVSGIGEAGSTITLTDAEGHQLGSVTVGEEGTFTVPLTTALINGETITAVASDAVGNDSAAVTVIAPDTTLPDAPTLTFSEDGSVASGIAEAGSTVVLTSADGALLGSMQAAEDGSYSVALTPALTNGEDVIATATDAAGNVSAEVRVLAPDITAPDVPEITAITDDIGSITGALAEGQSTDDARPQLSGTGEIDSLITVFDGNNEIGTAIVGPNNTWTFTPPVALTQGEHLLHATSTDASGNTSDASADITLFVDVAAPPAPNGTISADGFTLSGSAEPDSAVTVTLPDGVTQLTATATPEGDYSIPLPIALLNGESVTVTATDGVGNISVATLVTALDTTAPLQPTAEFDTDGTMLSGTAEAASNVTITLPDGGHVSFIAGDDGTYSYVFADPLTNDQRVTVTATDAAGNTSPEVFATAPDFTSPDEPTAIVSEDGASISGVAEANSIITITLEDGYSAQVQATPDGDYSYDFPTQQITGQPISVTASDAAGNTSPAVIVDAPVLDLAANDNVVSLDLTSNSEVTTTEYNDYGVLLVGALGNAVTLLGDDNAQVTFTIGEGATADVLIETSGTGELVTLLSSQEISVQQQNTDGTWTTIIDSSSPAFANLLTVGNDGVTLNAEDLGAGTYRVLAYNTDLLATGSYTNLDVQVTETGPGVVSGQTSFSGNVIFDDDPTHASDVAPAGSAVTQVTNTAGDVVAVGSEGATINGEYGTLTLFANGNYNYTLTNTSATALGHMESFTYTLSDGQQTDTAVLAIGLGETAPVTSNIVAVDDSAILPFDTTVTEIDNGTSTQTGFTLVNVGLGNVLDASVLEGIANPNIYTVADGTTRTMTVQAVAVGVSVLSDFDLYIYKFNDATQQYDEYRVVDNYLSVALVGGTSTPLTLTLDGGDYLFLLNSDSGISVATTYNLNVLQDHVYSVSTLGTDTAGNVMADDTTPAGTVVSQVNGVAVADVGITSIAGEYGVLTIDSQGNYNYHLNAGVGADSITTPDSFIYSLTSPAGEVDTATLNINPIASPLTAVDDSITLPATAVHDEAAFSDSSVATASWYSFFDYPNDGFGSGTLVVADNTELTNATITFDIDSFLSLGSLSISWQLLDANGEQLAAGTVNSGAILGGTATASLGALELDAGDYTLNLYGSSGFLSEGDVTITASVTGTSILLDHFHTEAATVEGNIFDGSDSPNGAGDQLVSVETQLSITDAEGNITQLDPYVSSDSEATVQGLYGVLTLGVDGAYSYALNNDVDLADITRQETFNYSLTASNGETANAALTIDLALQITGTTHGDTATSTAYNDSVTLGGGGDTLIFNLLNDADATGGNGHDTWTDFSVANGDGIDVSQLLEGTNASIDNLGNFLSVETVDGNTVISIDRDGQGSQFSSTELVTLQGVQVTLDELIENNAIHT